MIDVRPVRTCEFRGVCRRGGKWRALITLNQVQIPLGVFDNEEEAARAYDAAAINAHGEFASLNFPAVRRAA